MNTELDKIKKWFQKQSKSSFLYEKKGIHPKQDWTNLLIGMCLFVGVLVGASLYLYFLVQHDSLYAVIEDQGTQEEVVNANLLQKSVEWIETKDAMIRAVDNIQIPPEPSL